MFACAGERSLDFKDSASSVSRMGRKDMTGFDVANLTCPSMHYERQQNDASVGAAFRECRRSPKSPAPSSGSNAGIKTDRTSAASVRLSIIHGIVRLAIPANAAGVVLASARIPPPYMWPRGQRLRNEMVSSLWRPGIHMDAVRSNTASNR